MMPENKPLARQLNIVAVVLSIIVLGLVASMRKIHIEVGVDLSFLPAVYSVLNLCVAGLLIKAILHIRKRETFAHQRAINLALACSSLFLVLYVVYHITTPHVPYCGTGFSRSVYFALLITHVGLAATSFPFILFTYVRGYTGQYVAHKRMSRWVFWVWLYVAITGPICYILLLPCR